MVSGAISLILCLILGAVAVVGAREIRWKILNFLILFVLMILGLLLGYVVGLWTNDMALGAHITLLLGGASGCLGAFLCIQWNKARERKGSA